MFPESPEAHEQEVLVANGSGAKTSRLSFLLVAALHFLCCGVPLLLLSGMSLAFLVPLWPIAAATLAVVGVIGFAWYLKRGCATCPRNEGRCQAPRNDLAS